LANVILPELKGQSENKQHDSSTKNLIKIFNFNKKIAT
jgi:hypothetical protein